MFKLDIRAGFCNDYTKVCLIIIRIPLHGLKFDFAISIGLVDNKNINKNKGGLFFSCFMLVLCLF